MSSSVLRQAGRARIYLYCAVVSGALAAIATIAQMILLSGIIARVFLGGFGLAGLERSIVLLLGAISARSIFLWLRETLARQGAARVKQEVRERLLAHLLLLGPMYSGGERTGELVTTSVEGIERLDAYFARYLPQVILATLVPVLIAVYVLSVDPLSAAVLLTTGPAIVALMILIGKHAEDRTRHQWEALSRMGAHFLDALRGLPTLKAFGRAKSERARVARISSEFGERTMSVLRVAFVSGLALEFVATVSVGLIAVLLGVRLLYGDLSFTTAFPVLLLAPEFYRPIRELGTSRHAGMEGKAAAERIGEILDTPISGDTAAKRPAPDAPITVNLSGVGFSYPESESPALSNIDISLPAGTRTALIGPSGSGKSTVIRLLMGFAEPRYGSIFANDAPVSELTRDDWLEKIAFVPQQPYLFHGSVADNLRLANPGASREDIERAARLAGAEEFIRRLPRGYDTRIGENAARLSEGEAQRLAIARAFLKDAPVLVMDEAASSLDPESEHRIQTALKELVRDRTVLVVAHRLGTARSADRIVVLEDGHVAETGAHDDLAGTGGAYDRLLGPEPRDLEKPANVSRIEQEASPLRETSLEDETRQDEEPGIRSGTFRRLMQFLGPQRGKAALAAALAVWTAAANVGLLAVSGFLISAAALKPSMSSLVPAAVLVQIFGGSRAFTRYGERLVSHGLTFGLLADVRSWLYERLEPLSPARLMRRRGGDLLSRMVDDVEELQNVYLGAISPAVVAVTVSALACATLYVFAPPLALALLAFLTLAGIGVPALAGALERKSGRNEPEVRAALGAEIAEWLWGMRDLLAFGRARDRQDEIAELGDELSSLQRRTALVSGLREALHELLAGLAAWTVLLMAVPLVRGGEIRSVYLALLALTTLASFEAVGPLGEAIQSLGRSLASGARVFEVSDEEPTVTDPKNPVHVPATPALEFDRVEFGYEANEPPVFEDVSFVLSPGERIAMVGPSGSGKSTLANLMLRFWDADSGGIHLGGNDVRAYDQEDLRSALSVAAQGSHLFDATLRDNLLLAKPDATEGELWSALKLAQLAPVVSRLSNGLDSRVGESGSRLSGGERKRLSVARALLKAGPVLVLDEPTADLDTVTERLLMQTVHGTLDHAPGRSLLLITHRLIGMERMDEILALRNGRIVERGTHEELLASGGLYSRMVEVQNDMLASR